MKRLFILFIIILNTPLCAQTLSGKVYDADTKEALPGVVIYIPELKVSAVTDTAGHYKITNLPEKNGLKALLTTMQLTPSTQP